MIMAITTIRGKLMAMAVMQQSTWVKVQLPLILLVWSLQRSVEGAKVPCFFIFGASIYDNGNNNNLLTLAKVNYLPYGIDFPDGPTGRFTNGRNIPDFLATFFGFDTYIPSFATARDDDVDILKGVNYASDGSGIRDETGRKLAGQVISFNGQLINHKSIITRIGQQLGASSATEHLGKCIYTVGFGDNDYSVNYFLPEIYPTSRLYTPEQYAVVLAKQYSKQLRSLYKFGARKVAVFGVRPIGCGPSEVARFGTNGSSCVDMVNNAVQLFNARLRILINDLNKDFTNAKFTYINFYGILSDDFSSAGIRVTNAPCCQVGVILCEPLQTPCSNRSEYLYWDGVHLTEAANFVVAKRAYNAQSPTDANPIDISSLAQLQ